MDKGYTKDIEAEASNENKSISEKLAVFSSAAAVLGLVAAFNQNIARSSEPVFEDTVDRHMAQGFRDPKKKEMMDVYTHVKKNFEEIETMVAYLPHQEEIRQFDLHNSLTKRTIPSITVGGKIFKLEVESLDCDHGVTFRGECEQGYSGYAYKAPYRIILSNGEVRAVYQMQMNERRADLSLYDKAHPQVVNKLVVPNFKAFLVVTNTYQGEEYKFLDSKLGDLHAVLKVPYDAKKARQAGWNSNVKKKF